MDLPSLLSDTGAEKEPSKPLNIDDDSLKNHFKAFPGENRIKGLFNDAFVIHIPMSGVGGDGLWIHNENGTTYLAVFDCMGHGRLASMMTRIYINAIKKSIIEREITDPGAILMDIHGQIEEQFKDKEQRLVGCGADLGIVKIKDKNPETMYYSGAKMDLVKVQDGVLERFKGNRRQIGEIFEFERNYETSAYPISSKNKARYYLYSDGVTDVFGGPNDKKFTFKNLQPLLEEADALSMTKSKDLIFKKLNDWRGHFPPTDDTIMVCFEI